MNAFERAIDALRQTPIHGWWQSLKQQRPSLLARRARFRRWNRGAAAGEMILRPGLRVRIDPRSREPFEWFCFRSVEMASEFDRFLVEMATCQRFLDIGACHGIFSLAFTADRPEALAVAVEPSEIAGTILAENVRRSAAANVVIRQVACGASHGSVQMRQNWHHLEAVAGQSSQSSPSSPPAPASAADAPDACGDVLDIEMRTVDELCDELRFAPDLVKIDVEGYELAVLAGAQGTLAQHRPRLLLELHPHRLRELGSSAAEVVGLLALLGYHFLDLSGEPLVSQAVGDRTSVGRVVCVPGAPGG